MTGLWRDLVHAARSLSKARTFTVVCVASLGVGMAPVIAIPYWARIFSTPPPGIDADGLVELVTTSVGPRQARDEWSYADYLDLQGADSGASLAGWAVRTSAVTLPEPATARATVQTMFVSANYFDTMGVALARGPGLPGTTDPVVVLGDTFWRRRLAADPDIVGRTIALDGVTHVVAGIAPAGFSGHLAFQEADLFVPLERHPNLLASDTGRSDRIREWVHIHGRLAPGVSVTQTGAAVSALTTQLAREYPATNELRAGAVEPYHAIGSLEGFEVTIVLGVWLTLSATVLIVVCLNLSGMAQVRGAIRERELSIRQAIGATRGRLVQHLLAEAILLAAVGGAFSSLVLFTLPSAIAWALDEPIPANWEAALRLDPAMAATSIGTCLVASLVFGWLPATRFSRPAILAALKEDASGGVRAGRVHRVTTALQVAIAVPLVITSAVSLERVRATATADLGFDADAIYAAPLLLDSVDDDAAGARLRRVRAELALVADVASVSLADGLPLDFRGRLGRISLESGPDDATRVLAVNVTRVGDGYLDTMGISLLRGRGITSEDRAGSALVTVISAALAEQLAPGADLIGRRLAFHVSDSDDRPARSLTIVGVTGDFPTSQMSTDRAQLLLPLAQHPDVRRDSVRVSDDRGGVPTVMLVARAAAGSRPTAVMAAIENAVRAFDPDVEPGTITTGVWLRENSVADFLNQSAATGIIGGVILLLAALGIYGVVGLMVATRTREIAVRITLGASRARLVGMVVLDVVKLVAPGVVVGLIIAVALLRLEGGAAIGALEPVAYAAGTAIAVLTAIAAGLSPARRAASVEPMVAMRSE